MPSFSRPHLTATTHSPRNPHPPLLLRILPQLCVSTGRDFSSPATPTAIIDLCHIGPYCASLLPTRPSTVPYLVIHNRHDVHKTHRPHYAGDHNTIMALEHGAASLLDVDIAEKVSGPFRFCSKLSPDNHPILHTHEST